jgi:Zn-dependent metalloprotease
MFRSKLASLLVLIALLCAGAGFSAPAIAAIDVPGVADAALLRQLGQASRGAVRLARHAETGKARFLAMESQQPLWQTRSLAAATPEQAARAFLSTYGPLFGLRGQERELELMGQERLGSRDFVRFQQVYQGIPVLAGELVIQTNQQRAVMSANGEVMPDLLVSIQPSVAADAAMRAALAAIAKVYDLSPSELQATTPRLWIYNPALLGGPGLRISRLVWRMEVSAPVSAQLIRELVLVDAQTGTVALHFNQIAHARQRYVCDDKNVVDSDGNQDNNCTPAKYVRVEGQAPTGQADVDLAYDYAGITYDYYRDTFGRDSLDGKGMPLISLVRYCPSASRCPFANANWDGKQMTYGAGFAAADDVVAHELTHGLTDFTSHLFYYYQSGAINESLSDVFGELIDQADGRGDDSDGVRWLIGEDLPAAIGVLRNMRNPGVLPPGVPSPGFFPSPDRMTSPNYYGGPADRGGVHTNSGVNNKAAYLLTDGDTFNGQTIAGLGPAKVGAIYYTLQLAFLTSGSDYQDLYMDLPAACDALAATGAYSVGAADCAQVRKAVEATEMDIIPPAAPAPEAPVCAPGQASEDVFYDDLENPSSGAWVSAAAQGLNTWFYPATDNPFGLDVTYGTSGKQNFWGYDQGGDIQPTVPADYSIAMTRDIAVPANAQMHFRHAFEFEAEPDLSFAYDGGVVEYSTNGGGSWNDAGPLFSDNGYLTAVDSGSDNPLRGRAVFSGVSTGYYSSRLDLGPLEGEKVRFRFRIGTDPFVGALGWFIDDIRVYTCGAAPPVASLQAGAATVAESGGSIAIQLKLSGVTDQAVSVPFDVSGTAAENADYRLTSHAIVIPAGSASGRAVIEIADDGVEEPDETVILTLGEPSNASLGAIKQATITIQANDTRYLRYLPLISVSGG